MYVAVIGPGRDASADTVRDAYQVGRLLAERGCTVITGGLGGVMGEVARGCRDAGGQCVGLLAGADRDAGSEHLSIALPTGLGEMRNALLVRCADAVIAVGGSWGTLSELALAERTGVPCVSLGGWQVRDAGGNPVSTATASTPPEAVALLLERVDVGSVQSMPEHPDEERIEGRAHLLPEEEAAGSDDPDLQAEVILEDSDERTAKPEQTKRRSVQTPD
jgi:uncharacterized protein (TIGR00725 family)